MTNKEYLIKILVALDELAAGVPDRQKNKICLAIAALEDLLAEVKKEENEHKIIRIFQPLKEDSAKVPSKEEALALVKRLKEIAEIIDQSNKNIDDIFSKIENNLKGNPNGKN